MRIKFVPALLMLMAATLVLASCNKKSNTLGRYIPANAAFVVHVNTESITSKLPWEEIKQNEIFKAIYNDSSIASYSKAAMDDPSTTGIDMKKDIMFFVVKDSSGGYVAVQGTVKDADKFKAYNTAALKNARASEKDGIQYLTADRTTVSWNKDKFFVVTDAPEMGQMKDWDKMIAKGDSVPPVPVTPVASTRDGVATAALLYNLPEDKSLSKNEKFSEMLGNKGDMHFWANSEALYQDIAGMPGMAMINLRKLYEGAFTTGTVQFENGQINVDMKSFAGKELTDLIKKYSGTKVDESMLKRLPAKDVAVFFAMNFKPQGIKEFTKLLGVDGFIDMATAELGFNLDDFVKANKGDILFSLSDITKDSSGKPSAAVLFAASKGDKASFDKLVNAGKVMGGAKVPGGIPGIHFNQSETYFAIGNKKEYADMFVAKENGTALPFFDKITSGPIGGYANLQYIFNSLKQIAQTEKADSAGLVALDASIKMWDNALMSGGEFKNGGVTQHIEVNLVDKTTNSLKQLNTYSALLARLAQQKKKERGSMDTILQGDTTSVHKDSLYSH